jgi:AAA15 family ATPase/GTPase
VPDSVGNVFDVMINNQQQVLGLFISSHKTIFKYKQVQQIPTKALSRKDIYSDYNNFMYTYQNDEYRDPSRIGSTLLIKEALIALATFGYGNQAVIQNADAIKLFEGYQDVLKKVLPDKLGFEKLEIEVPEVVLKTKSGRFSFDAVSGGIAAIIELTWQIYMYDEQDINYVVIIDEPENHLHPELQRVLLPNLLNAFPNVQFIVATHNPFIISSVPASNVYVLDYNDSGKVKSSCLDRVNKAGSSNEILRDVLGIQTTIPMWVEHKLNEIVRKYSSEDMTINKMNEMRKELVEYGFEKLIPETIIRIVEVGEQR